VGVLIGR